MKRKRGHKKGKAKGSSASGGKEALGVSLKMESDSLDNENIIKYESGMEVDTPSSTSTAADRPPYNVANINPDGSIDRDRAVEKAVGRVKVKLPTPKTVDSQLTSSDAPTHSDTDKSSPQLQMGSERQSFVAEKMEDSANSLPQVKVYASGNLSKRAGSIKIKSSKVSGSSINQTSDAVPTKGEPKLPHQDPRFDKQELDTCLMVIKKVMKMDAAEPFNVPVNPVALGIPLQIWNGLIKLHRRKALFLLEGGNIDGIPDDIIVCILSLLPLKDAAATSVLSSRWRYLWRSAMMSLNFDVDRVIPKYGRLTDPQVHVKEYLNKRRKSYIRWVNKVVDQHEIGLKEVEVFNYDNEVGDMERILYLIKHAVALEKIIVNCKFDPPLRRLKTKEQIFKAEQIATTHAMTQLKPQIPSHIEFICRSHI